MKKIIGISLIAAMALSLTACGGSTSSTAESATDAATTAAESAADESKEEVTAEVKEEAQAPAVGQEEGFTEIPIFEDQEVGFMNVSAVYFQPVPMSGGNESVEDFDLHLEADISALANKLGYGVGDWVPYLTVDYDVIGSDGNSAASGTFMEMSASDGPHYGNNIPLAEGEYTVTLTIKSPAENGYLLHVDAETGVEANEFWTEPLTATWTGWKFVKEW